MSDSNSLKIKIEEAIVDLDPRERYTLEKLSKKLKGANLSPEILAQMLPEVFDSPGEQGPILAESITPITEQAIDISVQRDPEILSSALFPVIGGAIRKALSKMLSEMMYSMNNGLESVFSFKRLAWRFEAWKTGKTFFEVMLSHTLEYSVDHVFLIHKSSSLLLASFSQEGKATADDDMVSSMLTAIRNYIKDSLNLNSESNVEGIQAGEYTILVEEGPRALLALIVRGTPNPSLRTNMQETLEDIHVKLARPLKGFNGSTKEFEKNLHLLEPCLITKTKGSEKKKPILAIILTSILGFLLCGWLVFYGYRTYTENSCIKEINNEPGIVVSSYKRKMLYTDLFILRDTKAKETTVISETYPLAHKMLRVYEEAYYSPLFNNLQVSKEIPQHLLDIAEMLSTYNIYFEQDSGALLQGQETVVQEAGELVALLVEEAKKEGYIARVEITGHAAGAIQDIASLHISTERANMAFDTFIQINEHLVNYVSARGVGVSEPVIKEEQTEEDRMKNRSVTFKALITSE